MKRVTALTGVLYISCLLLFLIGASTSFAQEGRYDAYSLHLSSPYPSPGEDVTITVRTGSASTTNIRSVAWYINGEEQKELANKTHITTISDNSPKQVVANIVYFDILNQRRYTQVTQWMRPVIFDILWEGDSVTIPRYRGHKLAGPQTPIRVSANIQYIDQYGVSYTEKDFSFLWEVESAYHDDRGPGVSSITLTEGGTFLNNFVFVRAKATLINDNGTYLEKAINIPITEPRVLVYSHTLLYGLFTDGTIPKESTLVKKSATFSVYPFFFSRSDFEKDTIQYKWFIDGDINHQKEERRITISTEGDSVSIPIRIHVQNTNKKSQMVENSLSITS